MAYLIYSYMDINGIWGWSAPYNFVITVFHLLSLVAFFLALLIFIGVANVVFGSIPQDLVIGIYNSVVLRLWYLQPYNVSDPVAITDPSQVLANFSTNLLALIDTLWNNTFLFLYFLCAGIGVALFLQSLFKMEHKFVGGAFVALQAILIIGAFQVSWAMIAEVPNIAPFPTDYVVFLLAPEQILALVSFAYLEISYQMIYSYSVGKPVEDREETLKRQLLALRQATRKQDAIERGDKVSLTAMSRSSGATAFSFLREAIERKVMGDQDVLENLDAVSDVRRLQNFVDELLHSDPNARDELTAKAAAPSSSYVIGSTILGSLFRFVSVVTISFLMMSPEVILAFLNPPPGITQSAEMVQPEIVLLFLVPVVLLFPFIAMIIGWFSRREEVVKKELTEEEMEELKKRREELEVRKKEAEAARKEREKAAKKDKTEEPTDEWDKALEDTYKVDE
jgi:hypothetical protein